MQVNEPENRKEILNMVLCGDVVFILFRGGSIRGVDMKRYAGITKECALVFTPEELYDSGTAVFCMLWDGNGKLLQEEIISNNDGIYVRYGSRAHKALSYLYYESLLTKCHRLWL